MLTSTSFTMSAAIAFSASNKALTNALQAQGDVAAEHAMTLYKDVVRRLLRTTEGYECQEAEGNFMLAFHKPVKAVQFCLLVRAVLPCLLPLPLEVLPYGPLLALPLCCAKSCPSVGNV